jgi:hypothetical protein
MIDMNSESIALIIFSISILMVLILAALFHLGVPEASAEGDGWTNQVVEVGDEKLPYAREAYLSSPDNETLVADVFVTGNPGMFRDSFEVKVDYYAIDYNGNLVSSSSRVIEFTEKDRKKVSVRLDKSKEIKKVFAPVTYRDNVEELRDKFHLSFLIFLTVALVSGFFWSLKPLKDN